MQPKLPSPEHRSYLRHRKQRNLQIILPVVLSAALMVAAVALVSLATFNSGGDVARWAAVSTIWLAVPVLLGGLITLAALVALVYGLARALEAIPQYTGIAQDYVYIARGYIVRGAGKVSEVIIELESNLEKIKSFFQRIVP